MSQHESRVLSHEPFLMHIVHITPHLPPDQAANALLPYHLGEWAVARGDTVHYVAHPPVAGKPASLPGRATWIARRRHNWLQRWLRLGSVTNARRILREARPVIDAADIIAKGANVNARAARGQTAQATGAHALRNGDLALPAEAIRTRPLHPRLSRGTRGDVLQ